ncbi:MAG TPA: hypothetical protein VFS37_04870 [Conexibacter sp.]|nr:hypothetical protein [Conexibacter sp.]
MGLALTATFAFCLWVVLWAIDVKGFDGFMITLVILLVAGTIKSLGKFLPGASRSRGSSGGW